MDTQDRSRQSSVTDLFLQMFTLPVTGFFYGMDWMMRALQGTQDASAAGLDAVSRGTARTLETFSRADGPSNPWQEDRRMMNRDQDLSGDDLKLVRYTILFVKRDLETLLRKHEDLVAGDMDGGTFASLKVKDYLMDAAEGKIQPPPSTLEGYVEKVGANGWRIPDKDLKYLRVYFDVLERYSRQEREYDKQQVQVLQEISQKIG